jgi:hypothetical protein
MSQNHTTNTAAIMRKNRVLDGPIHTQRVKNVTADTRRRSTGGLAGGFVERGDLPDFVVMRAERYLAAEPSVPTPPLQS